MQQHVACPYIAHLGTLCLQSVTCLFCHSPSVGSSYDFFIRRLSQLRYTYSQRNHQNVITSEGSFNGGLIASYAALDVSFLWL